MKKLIAILLVALTVMAMAACGPKGGNGGQSDQGGGAAPQQETEQNANKEYYGTWKTVELHSLDGSIEDDIFVSVLEEMEKSSQLFYFEVGDTCYMYNPTGNGEYEKFEVFFDFDAKEIHSRADKADAPMVFEFKDGKIIIDEAQSGVQFVLGKE